MRQELRRNRGPLMPHAETPAVPNAEQHRRRFSVIRILVGARKLRRGEARQADAQQANADEAFAHAHRIRYINDEREHLPRTELLRMRTQSGACIIARPKQRLHRPLAELARPSAKPQFRGNSSMRILAGPRRAAQMRVAGKVAHPATRSSVPRRARNRPPIAA